MEVDPFTQRDIYEKTLSDFTEVLNQKTNQLLDLAVSDFNKNCQADLSRKEIHRMLAFKIFNTPQTGITWRRNRMYQKTSNCTRH